MSSRVSRRPSLAWRGVEVGWIIIWMDLTAGIQVTSGSLMVAGKREREEGKERDQNQPVVGEAALDHGKGLLPCFSHASPRTSWLIGWLPNRREKRSSASSWCLGLRMAKGWPRVSRKISGRGTLAPKLIMPLAQPLHSGPLTPPWVCLEHPSA